jgi:group I intron endonuclease
MYGRSHTDEAKKKQSARAKGNSHSKGRVMGDKQRKLISEFAKKRIGNLNPFFGKKHSAETIKKISASRIGKKPLNSRKVLIGGIVYESVTGAARSIGVDPALVIYRIKSTKYKDYEYFSENL